MAHSMSGVMQDYYIRNNTFQEENINLKLTFIGSLLDVLVCALVFIATTLYPFTGYRTILLMGIFASSLGLIFSGLSNSIWQLYLSLGVCTGLGMAFLNAIPVIILYQWFAKYRATAYGIQQSVYPLASTVFPFIMVYINNTIGPSWTYHIYGILTFVFSTLGFFFLSERLPRDTTKKRKLSDAVDISLLKNFNLIIWMVVGPIQLYATNIVTIFVPSYATYIGLSDVQGAAIVATLSGAGVVGRMCNGAAADKIGNLNAFIISMIIGTVAVLVNWMFAHTFSALMTFAVLLGLAFGNFYTIMHTVTIGIVGQERYTPAIGLVWLSFLIGIAGPVIASYAESLENVEPFFYCKIIAGAGYGACALLSLLLKFRLDRRIFAKV